MKLKVFSADGAISEERDFANFPAFEGDKGIAALRQIVIAHQANRRQGNAPRSRVAARSFSAKKAAAPPVRAHAASLISGTVVWPMARNRVTSRKKSTAR